VARGRRHLARRGHLTGEEPAEPVGGLDYRAITGDVGHRGEHVQRLCPRNARYRIHASAVMGRDANISTRSGFSAGEIRLTTVASGRSAAISASFGALSFSTTSAAHV